MKNGSEIKSKYAYDYNQSMDLGCKNDRQQTDIIPKTSLLVSGYLKGIIFKKLDIDLLAHYINFSILHVKKVKWSSYFMRRKEMLNTCNNKNLFHRRYRTNIYKMIQN